MRPSPPSAQLPGGLPLGCAFLAVYRVPRATYFAEKILDRKPYMSITNKILRRNVIPEFIQGHVNHQKIAKAVEQLLYDEKARQEMLTALSQLEEELGSQVLWSGRYA